MDNILEQNNNDPLKIKGGGSVGNDPLKIKGGGQSSDNDPLKIKSGGNNGNDPLKIKATPAPTSAPTPTPAPTAAPGATPAPTSTPAPTLVDTNLTGDDLTAGKVVKHGMRGDIVGKIQDLLIAKGFTNVSKSKTADKIFGNRTQRMVKAFQALNGLNDDGIVGKLTWGKLNDASAVTAGSTPDSSTNKATSVNSPEEVPGSDAIIVQESRKKILRKYLLQFK